MNHCLKFRICFSQKQLSQVDRSLNLNLCSQFLHDYHSRYSKYAFKAFDKDGSGLISTDDFCDMIFSIKVKTWTIQRNVKLPNSQHHLLTAKLKKAFRPFVKQTMGEEVGLDSR